MGDNELQMPRERIRGRERTQGSGTGMVLSAGGRAAEPSRTDGGSSATCLRAEGPRVGGLRHGFWRIVHPDGSVEEGRYVHGLLHGQWVLRDPSGAVVACETWRLGQAAGLESTGCGRPDG